MINEKDWEIMQLQQENQKLLNQVEDMQITLDEITEELEDLDWYVNILEDNQKVSESFMYSNIL